MKVISLEERQALYAKLPFEHFLHTEYHTYIGGPPNCPLEDTYTPVYIGPCVLRDSKTNEDLGYVHGIYDYLLFLRRFIRTKVGRFEDDVMSLDEWKDTHEQALVNAQANHDRELARIAALEGDKKGEIPI